MWTCQHDVLRYGTMVRYVIIRYVMLWYGKVKSALCCGTYPLLLLALLLFVPVSGVKIFGD